MKLKGGVPFKPDPGILLCPPFQQKGSGNLEELSFECVVDDGVVGSKDRGRGQDEGRGWSKRYVGSMTATAPSLLVVSSVVVEPG